MIVCCGEALIDMVPKKFNEELAYIPKVGGSVLNTSIALGRLGSKIAFLGSISKDIFGKMILDELNKSNVDTSLCMLSPFNTTLAIANVKDGTTTYDFFDENSSNRNLSLKNISLSNKVTSLYIGGLSLVSEPSGNEIESFINNENSDKVVFFDPNIRPNFINSRANYMKRFYNILAQSDIIKVSYEDLEWLYPNKSFDEVCNSWIELGVSIVILTKSSEGAMIRTKNCTVSSPGQKVEVIDTIGAGDIFNAGFLFSLSQEKNFSKKDLNNISEKSLEKSLAFGIKVSAISVGRTGANPPFINEIKSNNFKT